MVGGPRQQIQKKIGAVELTKDRIPKAIAIGCIRFKIDSFATGSQFSDGAPGPLHQESPLHMTTDLQTFRKKKKKMPHPPQKIPCPVVAESTRLSLKLNVHSSNKLKFVPSSSSLPATKLNNRLLPKSHHHSASASLNQGSYLMRHPKVYNLALWGFLFGMYHHQFQSTRLVMSSSPGILIFHNTL